ncbi:hypothetical protein HWV62_3791 [Athelia sp. TMB]|nr:hypothetical protein HWV62_3791 [Athelia sp. TMB]
MSLSSLKQQLSVKALSRRPHPDSMSALSVMIRVGLFTVLELAWIGFAAVCYSKNIPIGSDGDVLRIKAVWTTFTVFYQLVATSPLVGVFMYTFSCEWNRRGVHHQSKEGIAVSTLTAGMADRGIYALFKRGSVPFILAFIASLLTTTLGTVAPATISINPTSLNQSTSFLVGSFQGLFTPTVTTATSILSNALVVLEQVQNVSYGYDMPPGTLFGMPGRSQLGQNLTWIYDVVYFNYTCNYRAPVFSGTGPGAGAFRNSMWTVDGVDYFPDYTNGEPTLADRTGIWPLKINPPTVDNGTLAWLFIGANESIYLTGDQFYSTHQSWLVEFLSMEGIPIQNTTYNITGFRDIWPMGTPTVNGETGEGVLAVNASYSNSASVLLCDPHIRNETHWISQINQTFSVHEAVPQSIETEEEDWGTLRDAASSLSTILNPLLGASNQKYTARPDISDDSPMSPVNLAAGQLTLQALNHTFAVSDYLEGVTYYDVPLHPELIASKIGYYLQSAAKTQLVYGLLPITYDATQMQAKVGTIADNALIVVSVTILQTSLEQMLAAIALLVAIIILLVGLLIAGIGSQPLTVATVEMVLHGKGGSPE